MDRVFDRDHAECRETQALLSDYLDNTLSARHTWQVEKHLSACKECSAMVHQLQATLDLLHSAERFDTGDDFMAKLHARLDGLNPEPARKRSPGTVILDWLAGIRDTLRIRRAPVLSLGVAMGALAVMVVLIQPRTEQAPVVPPAITSPQVQQALEQQVAATASDPLGDAAAEKLMASPGIGGDSQGGISE